MKRGKKKMRKNKIGTIFLVAIFAIAGIGASYAGFFDDITVHGSVDTATVKISVVQYSGTWVFKVWGWTTEPGQPTNWPAGYVLTWIPAQEVLIVRGKPYWNLAEIDEWLTGTGAQYSFESFAYADAGTTNDVEMYYNELFPCIDFTADVIIHYDGSIPAHITVSPLVWDATQFNFGPYTTFTAYSYTYDEASGLYVKGNQIAFPVQMHFCEYVGIEVTIHLPQLEDSSLQGLSGNFSFNIHALQWNDLCP